MHRLFSGTLLETYQCSADAAVLLMTAKRRCRCREGRVTHPRHRQTYLDTRSCSVSLAWCCPFRRLDPGDRLGDALDGTAGGLRQIDCVIFQHNCAWRELGKPA